MRKRVFPKLAAGNIRKNAKVYLPWILTCILTVAMYYIMKSLSMNPGMKELWGGGYLAFIMEFGSYIIAVFSAIFLFYTYSFLGKRRKKEFGLFNMLGMEKKHIVLMLGWETLYVALISLSLGIGLGIVFDKLMFLLILRMVGAEIPMGFFLSEKVGSTILLFLIIFFLILCNTIRQLRTANPAELFREEKAGEKEPKSKGVLALLGLAAVGSGYYIAITTQNPLKAITLFFVAVLLVIAGTYLLFTAGSITLLKLLRKNRRFYYCTNHFVSVSGMIYRMKQNAVGLANICILSTMVLVMLSGTISLVAGVEDIMRTRYPAEFMIYSDEPSTEAFEPVRELRREWGIPVTKETEYTFFVLTAVQNGNSFDGQEELTMTDLDSMVNLVFIPLEDYNAITGENRTLGEGEVLAHSDRDRISSDSIRILGREYAIAQDSRGTFAANGLLASNVLSTHYIVVSDMESIYSLCMEHGLGYEEISREVQRYYGFDVEADEEKKLEFYDALLERLSNGFQGIVETRMGQRQSFMELYGGLFFLGSFLGVLFVIATVLIIYYKQISEGYEDRDRFVVMQKVGMSHDEVKTSIHSQVLTVFFLPLIVSGMHLAAAFPMVSRMLMTLNMLNTGLYMLCAGGVFLIFALMYSIVYSLTAKTYYGIVRRR